MINATTTLFLLTSLGIKHFIVDFPLQTKYQWSNKGTYNHLGGILHAGLHGIGTIIAICTVLWLAGMLTGYLFLIISLLGLLDYVIHYHVDWAKMNINKKYNWAPNTHEEFWWLLGLDQLLHFLTYILLVAIVINL